MVRLRHDPAPAWRACLLINGRRSTAPALGAYGNDAPCQVRRLGLQCCCWGALLTALHASRQSHEPSFMTSAGSFAHAKIQEHHRKLPWTTEGARPGTSPAHSSQPAPPPRPLPPYVQPILTLWGSRFLSTDVGVLRPGVATRPPVLIDIATGVRPAARLEWVIADMRLQLADSSSHFRTPSIPLTVWAGGGDEVRQTGPQRWAGWPGRHSSPRTAPCRRRCSPRAVPARGRSGPASALAGVLSGRARGQAHAAAVGVVPRPPHWSALALGALGGRPVGVCPTGRGGPVSTRPRRWRPAGGGAAVAALAGSHHPSWSLPSFWRAADF